MRTFSMFRKLFSRDYGGANPFILPCPKSLGFEILQTRTSQSILENLGGMKQNVNIGFRYFAYPSQDAYFYHHEQSARRTTAGEAPQGD